MQAEPDEWPFPGETPSQGKGLPPGPPSPKAFIGFRFGHHPGQLGSDRSDRSDSSDWPRLILAGVMATALIPKATEGQKNPIKSR